jgi:hypothetical protein
MYLMFGLIISAAYWKLVMGGCLWASGFFQRASVALL